MEATLHDIVSIQPAICLQSGKVMKPWVPAHLKEIDGLKFVKLSKAELGFCKFITGKSSRAVLSMNFLHELQKKRTETTYANALEAINGPSLFDNTILNTQVRQKVRKAANNTPEVVPPRVHAIMPTLTVPGGSKVPSVTLQLLSSLNARDAVWVEFEVN